MERRLAAILAADVVGYTALMGADEVGTLRRLTELRREVLEPLIAEHHGRIVKLMGDGLLVEFASIVDSIACALAWQESVTKHEAESDRDTELRFRIGINLGDVIVEDGDIHGDGVNIAARLEGLAEPGGICISEYVYRQSKGKVKAGFEDLGERDLKNVAEPLRVYRHATAARTKMSATGQAKPLPLPDKPSVAVLPFTNISRDPEQAYFSDGITDDIITDLSRYDELFVIARQSAFAYRDRSQDLNEIARELGVQYILEGSVRRAGNRVRVTTQLIDAKTRNHIWGERFDREIEDIFVVQDEITGIIVNTLVGHVMPRHYRRVMTDNPDAANAYDHALKAMDLIWTFSPRETLLARSEAELAVSIDPKFARAHALIAWTHSTEGSNGWSEDPSHSYERAYEHALIAVAADDREPWAHWALGVTHIWRDRAHNLGLEELRHALSLNPNSAHFRSMLAWALGWSGRAEDSLQEIETAMRLNPRYPGLYLLFRGRALFHLERYDDALPQLERAAATMPGHANALALLAACHAALGRVKDAKSIVQQICRTNPGFNLGFVRKTLPYANREHLDFFSTMLLSAGLPE